MHGREPPIGSEHLAATAVEGTEGDLPAVGRDLLDALPATWRDRFPQVDATAELLHATPADALPAASATAGPVVLGRRVRRWPLLRDRSASARDRTAHPPAPVTGAAWR
ncbi:hypothetical protein [Kitasatospora purpeofusca]|uniref:hypothetical protein n=1 Tax=Kitasatospora purpeofusca TaxID=67352 RepID=UPI0036D41266